MKKAIKMQKQQKIENTTKISEKNERKMEKSRKIQKNLKKQKKKTATVWLVDEKALILSSVLCFRTLSRISVSGQHVTQNPQLSRATATSRNASFHWHRTRPIAQSEFRQYLSRSSLDTERRASQGTVTSFAQGTDSSLIMKHLCKRMGKYSSKDVKKPSKNPKKMRKQVPKKSKKRWQMQEKG